MHQQGLQAYKRGITDFNPIFYYKDKQSTILLTKDNVTYVTKYLQMQQHPLPVETENQQGKVLNV
jgi:hypothetical protein